MQHSVYYVFVQQARSHLDSFSFGSVQSHARRMICERTVRPAMERNRAALKIQCMWRRYDAMFELELRFIEQDAAVAIQKIWRGFQERETFAVKVDAITCIQAIVRGHLASKHFVLMVESATSIQCIWRGFWAQLQTQLDFMDVITVQSLVRRKFAAVESNRRRREILILQRNFRRILATNIVNQMRKEQQEVRERTSAAITCQVSPQNFASAIFRTCKLF